MSELRAVAEKIFSKVKEKHPYFTGKSFEPFLQTAEKDERPPEEVRAFLIASLTQVGYFDPEDESEEEPEPRSAFEDVFHLVSHVGKAFLTASILLYAAKKVYCNNPVRALTSLLADATFPENTPEADKQLGKMTVEEFLEVHKKKLFRE